MASVAVAPAQGFHSSAEEWQDHRDTLPVATIFVTEMRDQIALLEEDSDESAEDIAAAIISTVGRAVSYRTVETKADSRAARLLMDLL